MTPEDRPVYPDAQPKPEDLIREAVMKLAKQLDAGPVSDAKREAIAEFFRLFSNKQVRVTQLRDAAVHAVWVP